MTTQDAQVPTISASLWPRVWQACHRPLPCPRGPREEDKIQVPSSHIIDKGSTRSDTLPPLSWGSVQRVPGLVLPPLAMLLASGWPGGWHLARSWCKRTDREISQQTTATHIDQRRWLNVLGRSTCWSGSVLRHATTCTGGLFRVELSSPTNMPKHALPRSCRLWPSTSTSTATGDN